MNAAQVREYGPPSVIQIVDLARPEPAKGEVLVRVKAASVGPWDALTREGKNIAAPSLPLILGSDLAGVVEAVGPGVPGFNPGDEIFGSTNRQFVGAYSEFACASAGMIAPKPASLNFVAASSAPVVAVTAWQMLFEYAKVKAGQKVLIHGAAGNVGAYAVQLAKDAGARVIATASARDAEFVRSLGAQTVIDYQTEHFEDAAANVDAVIDTVDGEVRERSLRVLSEKGILVSVASPIPEEMARKYGPKVVFFLVEVSAARLNTIGTLFDSGRLSADVGTVLRLEDARTAHQMLAGAPHQRGKIVLTVDANI